MYKILNILMFLTTIVFVFFVGKHYLSFENVENKNFNRKNVDQILKKKITNLPVLENDTNNIIEFNNSLEDITRNKKKRSFWELFRNK